MGMKVEAVKISESLCDICKKKERKEKKVGQSALRSWNDLMSGGRSTQQEAAKQVRLGLVSVQHEAHRRAESPAVARRVGRAHFTLKLWRRE